MAFKNEYIQEADYEKYDLRRICGEHNLKSLRGHMYSRSWTIDRERDAFLIQVWSHHEAKIEGYAFYWKSEWLFFEMATIDGEIRRDIASCWILFHVKKLVVPQELESKREELLADFQAAITASLGGYVRLYPSPCHHRIHRGVIDMNQKGSASQYFLNHLLW